MHVVPYVLHSKWQGLWNMLGGLPTGMVRGIPRDGRRLGPSCPYTGLCPPAGKGSLHQAWLRSTTQ